jgi:hypothetical protein
MHMLMHRGMRSRTKHNETPHAHLPSFGKEVVVEEKTGLQNKCIDASEAFLWLNTLVSL